MKKLLLLTSLFMIGACSTAPDSSEDTRPYRFTTEESISTDTKFKTINNDTERALIGTKWKQLHYDAFSGGLFGFLTMTSYYKYDDVKGKLYVLEVNDSLNRTNHTTIYSFYIEEDVWGEGKHQEKIYSKEDSSFIAPDGKEKILLHEISLDGNYRNDWLRLHTLGTDISTAIQQKPLLNADGENTQIYIKI